MRLVLKTAVVAYFIVVVATTAMFFIQQQITYNDHIRPARKLGDRAFRAVITPGKLSDFGGVVAPAKSGEALEQQMVTIQFLDTQAVNAHAGLGNEIEEHMLSLLWLNLATSVVVGVLCLATLKLSPQPERKRVVHAQESLNKGLVAGGM